eukprot:TRINITY_DN15728_c0_g1_i1.p1 TRINITY_DN15728_c0_g1~~TRINITY_DN15728_c0_g1_i1.p1  ORF type:complete len:275 (-),score=61.12 TRINITY_DN15728_c0_g1_i1:443-1267(-)
MKVIEENNNKAKEHTKKTFISNVKNIALLNHCKKNSVLILGFCRPVLQEILLWYATWWGPFLLLLLCYFSNFIFLLFDYLGDHTGNNAVKTARRIVSKMWSSYLYLWHGQTFRGLENIPRTGRAIIVWYHGPMPVDYMGLVAEVFRRDGRVINSVVDRSLHYVPGLGRFRKHLGIGAFSKVHVAGLLEDGELVGIAPGGSREALFDDSYSVFWGERVGFAKVASLTQTPIIPVFTENIRLPYSTMASGKTMWRGIFEVTKLALVPIYGGFPVQS